MTNNQFCTNCGKAISKQSVACMLCGAKPVGHKKFCRQCGVMINPEQVVCIKCGVSVVAGYANAVRSAKPAIIAGIAIVVVAVILCLAMFLFSDGGRDVTSSGLTATKLPDGNRSVDFFESFTDRFAPARSVSKAIASSIDRRLNDPIDDSLNAPVEEVNPVLPPDQVERPLGDGKFKTTTNSPNSPDRIESFEVGLYARVNKGDATKWDALYLNNQQTIRQEINLVLRQAKPEYKLDPKLTVIRNSIRVRLNEMLGYGYIQQVICVDPVLNVM